MTDAWSYIARDLVIYELPSVNFAVVLQREIALINLVDDWMGFNGLIGFSPLSTSYIFAYVRKSNGYIREAENYYFYAEKNCVMHYTQASPSKQYIRRTKEETSKDREEEEYHARKCYKENIIPQGARVGEIESSRKLHINKRSYLPRDVNTPSRNYTHTIYTHI